MTDQLVARDVADSLLADDQDCILCSVTVAVDTTHPGTNALRALQTEPLLFAARPYVLADEIIAC
jgi:hypothetical protein